MRAIAAYKFFPNLTLSTIKSCISKIGNNHYSMIIRKSMWGCKYRDDRFLMSKIFSNSYFGMGAIIKCF
jgi:hypothetical protein